MIPLRKPIATLALLALLASACSSGSAVVATIGTDTEITETDLGGLYATETLPVNDELRSDLRPHRSGRSHRGRPQRI